MSSGTWAALTLICEHSRYPLRMETQCFFPSFLAVMLRAGPHTCQAMLFHSAAAQLYHFVRIKKPNATLLNPPKRACLGVQENGSATFIDTLVRGGEQRSELLHSLPSPVHCRLSYQLRLVLRTHRRRERPSIYTGLGLGLRSRMGWWNTASSAACDRGYTRAQA